MNYLVGEYIENICVRVYELDATEQYSLRTLIESSILLELFSRHNTLLSIIHTFTLALTMTFTFWITKLLAIFSSFT